MNASDADSAPRHAAKTPMTDISLTRRALLGTLGAAGLGTIAGCTNTSQADNNFETGGNETQLRQEAAAYLTTPTLYKTPSCTCCGKYKKYLESKTATTITVKKVNDLARIKNKYNVPKDVESCHTMESGKYFIEGHVPREAIGKLALDKPGILGIALPNMPAGSPGMGGKKTEEFVIYAVENDGSSREFMRI